MIGERARQEVHRSTCAVTHQECYGLRRIVLRRCGRREAGKYCGDNDRRCAEKGPVDFHAFSTALAAIWSRSRGRSFVRSLGHSSSPLSFKRLRLL